MRRRRSRISIVHRVENVRVGVARPDSICRRAIVQSRSRICSEHACSRRRVSVPIFVRVAMVQVGRGADPAGPRSRPANVGAAHPGNERGSISISSGTVPSCACSYLANRSSVTMTWAVSTEIPFNERIASSQSSSCCARADCRGGLPVQRYNGRFYRGVHAHPGGL